MFYSNKNIILKNFFLNDLSKYLDEEVFKLDKNIKMIDIIIYTNKSNKDLSLSSDLKNSKEGNITYIIEEINEEDFLKKENSNLKNEFKKGQIDKSLEIAKKMLEMGFDMDKIFNITGIKKDNI